MNDFTAGFVPRNAGRFHGHRARSTAWSSAPARSTTILAAREERKDQHVAIVRVEQLYPFPAAQVRDILARYPPTAEVVWAQEEPRNMGAWRFVREQMQPLLDPRIARCATWARGKRQPAPARGSATSRNWRNCWSKPSPPKLNC